MDEFVSAEITNATAATCPTQHAMKWLSNVISKENHLILISNLVYSNPQTRVPTGPKTPEIVNIDVFGLSHEQIEKL